MATGCYIRAPYLFVPGAQKAGVWASYLSRWMDSVHVMRSELEYNSHGRSKRMYPRAVCMGTLGGVYGTGVLATALEVEWSQGTGWMESLTLAELTQNTVVM